MTLKTKRATSRSRKIHRQIRSHRRDHLRQRPEIFQIQAEAGDSLYELKEQLREDIQVVTQRKYGVDKTSPWWRRLFFRYAYLPFNRFARKRMGIPALDTVDASGELCWHEIQGLFTDEQRAKEACKGEFWRVKPLPLDGELPEATCQYGASPVYPRSSRPNRYADVFDLTATPNIAALRREIRAVQRVLET